MSQWFVVNADEMKQMIRTPFPNPSHLHRFIKPIFPMGYVPISWKQVGIMKVNCVVEQ
jgi:hypothetical protein